jgi:hypothetical protein
MMELVGSEELMGAVFKIYASPAAVKRDASFIGRSYERRQCPNMPSDRILLPSCSEQNLYTSRKFVISKRNAVT